MTCSMDKTVTPILTVIDRFGAIVILTLEVFNLRNGNGKLHWVKLLLDSGREICMKLKMFIFDEKKGASKNAPQS